MKKIKLISLFAAIGMFGISQIAFAANSILSVSPASLDNTVGKAFNISVQLDPASNKVCVVKGTLNLDNLSCQNITVADGLMIQTNPTCSNPSFTVGIPKCSTAVANILSVSVKGTQAGQSNLSVTGTKVIGVGVDVPFTLQSGVYQIAAVPTTNTQTTTVVQPTQKPVQQIATTTNTNSNVNLAATVGLTDSASNGWMNYLVIVLVILIVIYGIYNFAKRKKQ